MLEAEFFEQPPEQRAILKLGFAEIDYPDWETIPSWPFYLELLKATNMVQLVHKEQIRQNAARSRRSLL
jgi:hypothetical protein